MFSENEHKNNFYSHNNHHTDFKPTYYYHKVHKAAK